MSQNKTLKAASSIAVVIATILAWLSGYFVMQIVYHSIAASIIFGTVWAVIVFCESRFSHISLKSDGRVEITKKEIKSNLLQIIAATLVALLVTIPLLLKIYASKVALEGADLGTQIKTLGELFLTQWIPMAVIALVVVAIYQVPIFIRMASED